MVPAARHARPVLRAARGGACGWSRTIQQVKELETRLKLAAGGAAAAGSRAASPAVRRPRSWNRRCAICRKGSVEKFGAIVQPILLNRCAANQCHGPNAKSEFRLLRPPPGQIVSRRFTQRNLYAALQYVDRANPEASPLVVLPQQRHGNSLSAVFDKHIGQPAGRAVGVGQDDARPSPHRLPQPRRRRSRPPRRRSRSRPSARHAADATAGAVRA